MKWDFTSIVEVSNFGSCRIMKLKDLGDGFVELQDGTRTVKSWIKHLLDGIEFSQSKEVMEYKKYSNLKPI